MVKSINYAAFPHIFVEVIRYCDFATQKTLRLLSSSTKTDVDRDHCHYLYVSVQGGKLRLDSLLVSADRVNIMPPFLSLWDGRISPQSPLDPRAMFCIAEYTRSALSRL